MQTLPGNWSPAMKPECSDSALAPAMDVTAGITVGLAALLAASIESNCGFVSGSEECNGGDEGKVMLTGALLATPFILAGVYGIHKGNECERAKRQHHAYIANELSPAPRGPMNPIFDTTPSTGPGAPGQVQTVSPECDPEIAAYQAEVDPAKQAILYRDMSRTCRARITRTYSERDYEREVLQQRPDSP